MEHIRTPHAQRESSDKVRDVSEARELIHELYEKGERPVVSVPEKYAEALNNGLRAHTTWIPDVSVIAGTFGRDPYVPNGEKRILVRVEVEENQIVPRFTGPSHSYEGVVILNGPIAQEHLRRLN